MLHRFSLGVRALLPVIGVVAFLSTAAPAAAGAIDYSASCFANTLFRNDDSSSGLVSIGFTIDFFGAPYSSLYVNNNGNVTFDFPYGSYTPFPLISNGVRLIAPFWADVDTRNLLSGQVHWGSTTFRGRPAFCVTWADVTTTGVGYYGNRADKLNNFQLLVVDRSDVSANNFNIVFNYDKIQWETGEASGGTGGLGGSSARSGYANPPGTTFELPGSGINGAFLDSNPTTGLIHNSLDSTVDGQYVMLGPPIPPPTNQPPTADAGSAQTVNEGQEVVLDASGSSDPDGDTLTYVWAQIGGPSVTLFDATSAQATFTAPFVALGGETLTFQVTVTDDDGESDKAIVSVTVANVNHEPVADAGGAQVVAEGALVLLNGSASFDVDRDTLTYAWSQVGGPPVALTDANTSTPTFTAPFVDAGGVPGVVATLEFSLTVDDGYGGQDVATVTVEITNTNNLPTADAGPDQTRNENTGVVLDGTASSDPDGDALTYSWTQIGGSVVTLTDANSAVASLTTPFVSAGGEDLVFALTVDDGYGGITSDTVVIHVQNANDPPLVTAARPTIECIWPPDHRLVSVGITGVSDPESNATIAIDKVTSDEPEDGLGDGDTAGDAVINPGGTVLLRAERSGTGDGRVYTVYFTASDLEGSASGAVTVCVPHNRRSTAVDSGVAYTVVP